MLPKYAKKCFPYESIHLTESNRTKHKKNQATPEVKTRYSLCARIMEHIHSHFFVYKI